MSTITDRQRAFIDRLATERALTARMAEFHGTIQGDYPVSAALASRFIDALKAQPYRETETAPAAVPAGLYATPSATGGNDLDFWKVDAPTTGRWAGHVFVRRIIGGRDATPVRHETARAALAAISAAGVHEAATAYGVHIGRCYRCNRTLTDDTSRALGIGPDCRTKVA